MIRFSSFLTFTLAFAPLLSGVFGEEQIKEYDSGKQTKPADYPDDTFDHLNELGAGNIDKIRSIKVYTGTYETFTVVTKLEVTYKMIGVNELGDPVPDEVLTEGNGGTLAATVDFGDDKYLVGVSTLRGGYVDWISFIDSDGVLSPRVGGKLDQENEDKNGFFQDDGAHVIKGTLPFYKNHISVDRPQLTNTCVLSYPSYSLFG
jgi:hypothetical protein